jgi:hypothetical protein
LAIRLERHEEHQHGQERTQGKQGNPQAEKGGRTQAECLEAVVEGHVCAFEGLSFTLIAVAAQHVPERKAIMVPSSTLCRTQERIHLRHAADTPLENVRIVATNAAVAWGREADAAEQRERRHEKTRLFADRGCGEAELDRLELLLSEHPARALAAL